MKTLFVLVQILIFFGISSCNHLNESTFFDFGCSIVGKNKKLYWQSSFLHCVYFEDGSYIASKNENLFKFDNQNLPVWRESISVHHQMKRYGEYLYLIAEEINDQKNKEFSLRKDILVRLSLKNRSKKIINYTDFIKKISSQDKNLTRLKKNLEELTHLNAINRIENDSLVNFHPAWKKGNFLLTDTTLSRLTIINEEFDKILWTKKFNFKQQIHDAQLLNNGKLIVFMNGDVEKSSTISELNIVTGEYNVIIGGDQKSHFFASIGGGVQLLRNGSFLVNGDNKCKCAYIIDPNSKINKIKWSADFHEISGRDVFFQEVKSFPYLESFLRSNAASEI